MSLCRFLRQKGLPIGPGETADALKALADVPVGEPELFQLALRTVLTRSVAQQQLFDEWYPYYWDQLAKAVDAKIKDGDPEESQSVASPNQKVPPALELYSMDSWLQGSKAKEQEELAAYSAGEVLTRKDFSFFSEEELQEIMRIILAMTRTFSKRFQRRHTHARRGSLDLRRTLRKNLRWGGEMLFLQRKHRKPRRYRLVMLCDVSKSMDLYSKFLVQFIYALQNVYERIETFVFSTSLFRITEALRHRSFEKALEEVGKEVDGWSGGTRIGESLHTFVEDHAGRMLDNRTLVLILSDGWDTGDTTQLADSMAKIHSRAAGVIWLNPLAGSEGYQPSVAGMEAALPFIDVFAPAHNVESLRQVLEVIGGWKG